MNKTLRWQFATVILLALSFIGAGTNVVLSTGAFTQNGTTNLNGNVRIGDTTAPGAALEVASFGAGVLRSTSGGVITSVNGSNGEFLSVVAGVPTWTTIASGGGSVTLAGDVTGNSATNTAVALTGTAGAVDMKADTLTWNKTTTAGIIQAPETTDVAPTNFSITPGAAFGPGNKKSGDVVVNLFAPVSGAVETDEDAFIVKRGATNIWGLRVSQATYATLYAKGAIAAPTTANYTLLADGSSLSVLNSPSGGSTALAVNNASIVIATSSFVTMSPGGSQMFTLGSSGLRIGGSATPTHALDIAASGGISFDGNLSTPVITQAAPTNAAGQSMIVAAQSANGGDRDGGSLTLAGGAKTGSGTHGSVFVAPGGSPAWTFGATETTIGHSFVTFSTSTTSPSISHTAGTNAHGWPFTVTAQPGNGSDKHGGPIQLYGGTPTGTGQPGSIFLATTEAGGTSSHTVQVVSINGRKTVLNRQSQISATQLPAGTGDLVTYIGDAPVLPTSPPVGGGILYSESGVLKWMDSAGSTHALYFFSPSVEGMPANDNGLECEPWQRECAGWR